ncbi:MAG: CDP-alcohol phosphatidyltransferase family protein [bacterium]|nr:CDP-alcohol phosphatidyltransferase family protein [bacterium]
MTTTVNDEQIYNSILPSLIVAISFLTVLVYYGMTWPYRKKTQEVLERMHKSFLGVFFREFWYWFTDPVVLFFKITRFTPNMVTGLSIFLSIFTGYLFFIGEIGWGGWMVVVSGSMDTFDGRLARMTDQSSRSGEFFDACVDRYSDAFVFMGIALYFVSRYYMNQGAGTITTIDFLMLIVSMLTLVGTEVMSYIKARGEAMGFTTKRGLMQRPERVALLALFTVLHPFFKIIADEYQWPSDISLIGVMILMAVLINFSAIVRLISIFRDIKRTET